MNQKTLCYSSYVSPLRNQVSSIIVMFNLTLVKRDKFNKRVVLVYKLRFIFKLAQSLYDRYYHTVFKVLAYIMTKLLTYIIMFMKWVFFGAKTFADVCWRATTTTLNNFVTGIKAFFKKIKLGLSYYVWEIALKRPVMWLYSVADRFIAFLVELCIYMVIRMGGFAIFCYFVWVSSVLMEFGLGSFNVNYGFECGGYDGANVFSTYFLRCHFVYLIYMVGQTLISFCTYHLYSITASLFYIGTYLCPADLFCWLKWFFVLVQDAKMVFLYEWSHHAYVNMDEFILQIRLLYKNPNDVYDIKSLTRFFCFPKIVAAIASGFMSFCYILCSSDAFIFCGCFFAINTLLSLILLPYLGLYGVLVFNGLFLLLFWWNVVAHFNFFMVYNGVLKVNFGKWFTFMSFKPIFFEINIDSLSYSYILLTLTIALFVFVYTFSYFRYEPNVERLLLLINLFVASMILLVSGGNLFVMYLGWECIGLTSFFLINYWSTKPATSKAAFKAYVFNKFSDVSLFGAILLTWMISDDVNIYIFSTDITIFQNKNISVYNDVYPANEIIVGLLIFSAFIKSAQFGGHIWLPDSMEAPVPASALIHSATLVSAGIFLVLRFFYLFEQSAYAISCLLLFGSFTAFFGGCAAMFQSDAKRILAYSTISHCGFLMVVSTLKVPELTIFYLYVHGFFKAAVFLCVGNIIRYAQNNQDVRTMGKYWKVLPLECLCALICLANLAGLPFTLGFFIKHFLIISALNNNFLFYYVGVFLVLSAFTGLFYSYRLYSNVFFDSKKSDSSQYISTSRIEIKSWLFSSTTVSANFAIIGLILCGTLFSFTHFYLLVKLSYLLFLYLILLSFNFWCCLLLLVDGLLFLQMPK